MRIYNTLTREKEELIPQEEGHFKYIPADQRFIIIFTLEMHGPFVYLKYCAAT